jgi:hypothetical protein
VPYDLLRSFPTKTLYAFIISRTHVYRVLVGRPEYKRPLGRPSHRWEDNIKMDFRKIGMDSAGSGQSPMVSFCEHGNEPPGSIKKSGLFFDKLSDHQLFKEYPAPWL